MKKVNGRVIPEANDFIAQGGSFQNSVTKWDSLDTELAGILSSVKGADAIDVNKVTTDSIRSNPDIDSCVLTTVGGATRFIRSVRLSATAGDTITAIQRLTNGGGADSIKITINGVSLKFLAVVEE
jgi:hypothetical protein